MDVLAKLDPTETEKAGMKIVGYDPAKLRMLSRKDIEKIWNFIGHHDPSGSQGMFLGYTDGATEFHIAFKDGNPAAFHIKGDGDGGPFNVARPDGTTVFSGGSRLNRKTRRSKRNGRNAKHRKLRKLSTRRR